MLDQSAVFDTVSQGTLRHRFKHWHGIEGKALDWLSSYFSDRLQAVRISGKCSTSRPLETGFPQGSVLGPFSYPAYTAPLLKYLAGLI